MRLILGLDADEFDFSDAADTNCFLDCDDCKCSYPYLVEFMSSSIFRMIMQASNYLLDECPELQSDLMKKMINSITDNLNSADINKKWTENNG